MKKILALLLCALMLTPAFLSCSEASGENSGNSGSQAEQNETESEVAETELSDDLPEVDYEGNDFTILSLNYFNRDSSDLLVYDEFTGDPINDTLFEARTNVEDRFNVVIEVIDSGDVYAGDTAFRNSVVGGDDSFDLYLGNDHMTMALGKEGLCLNLMDVEQFNMEKPWWPSNIIKSLSIGDKMFAASSYLTYLGLHWTRTLMVNKDLLENYNIEIPYNTVREGKWTLDKLYSLTNGMSYDIDGNGKITADDEIALAAGNATWYCVQESCNINIVEKDENNLPYLNIDMERLDKYVNTLDKLLNSGDFMAEGDFGVNLFNKGSTLFVYGQIGDAYDYYRNTDIRYGVLPNPKLDEMQSNYINTCTDMLWTMPKTLVGYELEKAGTIIEALSCYNYKNLLPVYFEGTLKARISDAPDDSEMMQIIADTRSISFGQTFQLYFRDLAADCVLGSNKLASYIASNQTAAEKAIADLIAAYEDIE